MHRRIVVAFDQNVDRAQCANAAFRVAVQRSASLPPVHLAVHARGRHAAFYELGGALLRVGYVRAEDDRFLACRVLFVRVPRIVREVLRLPLGGDDVRWRQEAVADQLLRLRNCYQRVGQVAKRCPVFALGRCREADRGASAAHLHGSIPLRCTIVVVDLIVDVPRAGRDAGIEARLDRHHLSGDTVAAQLRFGLSHKFVAVRYPRAFPPATSGPFDGNACFTPTCWGNKHDDSSTSGA